MAKQAEDKRVEDRVAEERTKILSEHKIPVTRGADGTPPSILSMRGDLGLKERNREGAGAVDAAVAAYNAGRYRTTALPGPQK